MTAIPVFLQAITLFKRPSSITEVEGCDARDDDSSTEAGKQKL
jgi:hypothetical protein